MNIKTNTKLKKIHNVLMVHKGNKLIECFVDSNFIGEKQFPFTLKINNNQGAIEIFDSSDSSYEIQVDNRKFKVLSGGIGLTPIETKTRQLIIDCLDSPQQGTFTTLDIYQSPEQSQITTTNHKTCVLFPDKVKLFLNSLGINTSRITVLDFNPQTLGYKGRAGDVVLFNGKIFCKLTEDIDTDWLNVTTDIISKGFSEFPFIQLENLKNGETVVFDSYLGKWVNIPIINPIRKPVILSPLNDQSFYGKIEIQTNNYKHVFDVPHKETQYQLSLTEDFSNIVVNEISSSDLYYHILPYSYDGDVYLRVRYISEDNERSEFSQHVKVNLSKLYALQPTLKGYQVLPSYKIVASNSVVSWNTASELQRASQLFISQTGIIGDYEYNIGRAIVYYIAPNNIIDFWSATLVQRENYSFITNEDGKIEGYIYTIKQ